MRYWADPEIFSADAQFSYHELEDRVRQTAFLIPGLGISIIDERGLPGTPGAEGVHKETFHYEGGTVDFVDFLATDPAVTDSIHLVGSGTFTENAQVFDKESGPSSTSFGPPGAVPTRRGSNRA